MQMKYKLIIRNTVFCCNYICFFCITKAAAKVLSFSIFSSKSVFWFPLPINLQKYIIFFTLKRVSTRNKPFSNFSQQLPLQDVRSCCKVHPGLQEQMKIPTVFVQVWWQGVGVCEHSLMSVSTKHTSRL